MLTTRRKGQKRALAMLLAFVMVVTGCFGSMGPAVAQAASTLITETPAVAVTGQGVITGGVYSASNVGFEKAYTMEQLKAIAVTDANRFPADRYSYSSLNTYGTKRLYLAEGIRLDTLLLQSGVSGSGLSDNVISAIEKKDESPYVVQFDPARTTFGTPEDLAAPRTTQAFSVIRHYYPGILTGSGESAVEVPTILAWANNYSTSALPTTVTDKTSLVLMPGQLGMSDYNNPLFNSVTNTIQVGSGITETALTVGTKTYTRSQLLMMDRATSTYTYSTTSGPATDYARGVPMSVLLAGYATDDVVTFTTADGYPVAASGKTVAELIENDYMLAYEKGTTADSMTGIYTTSKSDPNIFGLFTLYGADAEGKPSKMVTSISVTPASGIDYENSPYKHINNGGITAQSGPYDVDAITGATLTVEGPGVETSIPLSVRTVEEQNAGAYRGIYSDEIAGQTNTKSYEGIKLSYILNNMPDTSAVTLTDAADRLVIKNRARQTIASFTLAQIEEADAAGSPIIVAYGVGTQDESSVAPFVYDGQAGSIPGLYNEDGCLKLVYSKSAITGDTNTSYTTFGNMAYIYVEEGESPGYKHTTTPYNDAENTQYLLSLTGTGMGREVNLTVAQLEALAIDDSATTNTLGDYTSSKMGLRKEYSLTNTTYWSVNEYEGLKLYDLLSYFKMKTDLGDSTLVRFNAWDGYVSNETFTIADLKNPDTFGYYEKNALDLNDGTYVPVAEDLKAVGYPVLLAYGVNNYPYVKTPSDAGFANGLNNSGGPLRVIYGKRTYNTNNGSNQVQKVQEVIVGEDTYQYSTHKYHESATYTAMAEDTANNLQVVVNDAEGDLLKQVTYSLGDVEDMIYGEEVSKIDAALAKSKAYMELLKNGSYYNDVYEGVSLSYLIKNLLEVPGVKGTVTISDGTTSVDVSLERLLALGTNSQSGVDNLAATLAFAKNGAPLVQTSTTPGYEKEFTLGDASKVFTVKNDGGPLTLLIPSTTGMEAPGDAISLKNVKSITIDLQADSFTHSDAPYSQLSSNTVTVSGPGTYLQTAKEFTVAELEGKQTLALTADYNIKDESSEQQVRYRGLSLYNFLKSSAVGLRLNANTVKVTGEDGTIVEFSIADIMKADYINGQNTSIGNLTTMLAFGSSSVENADLEDGRPLVIDESSEGYVAAYLNAGGPIKLVTGQADAADQNSSRLVTNVVSIEVSATETVAQNHSISDLFKTYLADTFTIRVQNADNTSGYTKVYTVAELEAMTDILVNDEFTWVGINQHEGLDLWDLVKKTDSNITDDTAISSVTVYDGTFTKDILSIFGKSALVNGITDSNNSDILKPIILAYSQNGLPLVASTTSDGYAETAGNTGGPLRLITHENQGACVRNADGVTIVLSGTDPVDDPQADLTLTVDGEEMTFAVSELKAMTSTTLNYAKKSAVPNRTAKGVMLYDLLKAEGVINPDALITFSTPDNFQDSSKALGYKNVTLRDIKAQQYMVAYSGADVADAPDESLVDFNDLVKNTTITTKLRVYRNYTTDAAAWYNEMTNISKVDASDYAIAIKTDTTTLRLTLDDLKAMKATTQTYKVKTTDKTVTGALLSDILTVMGVNKPRTTISLVTYDNYNHATYTNIPLSQIAEQDYLIAYMEGSTAIADLVKNDTVTTPVRIYRYLTTDTALWVNEAKSVVTIQATDSQYDFDQWLANGNELPVSGIRSILSDNLGGYWIGSYGGGLIRRTAQGTTTVYNLESTPALETTFVSAIAPDQTGGIWFSQNASYLEPGQNKGLIYMNAAGELTKYTVETTPGTIPDNYVQALYLDHGAIANDASDDVLWIGTFAGLTKYDLSTDTWTTYAKTAENPSGFPATSVTTITPAADGNLWVGFYPEESGTVPDNAYTGGCIRFDVTTGVADPAFTQIYTADTDPIIGQARLADAWVRSIAVDELGGAYIVRAGSTAGLLGTVGGHVDYVAADGTVSSYTGVELLGSFLTGSSEIRTMTIDSNGNLWFGTSANGVAYCEPPVAGTPGTVLKTYSSKNQAWLLTNPGTGLSTLDNIYVTTVIGETLLVGSAGGVSTLNISAATATPDPTVLTIYDHETVKGEFTLDLLNSMAAVAGGIHYNYAGYNTVPSWKTSLDAQGPTVESLFEKAGIDLETMSGNTLITFVASDNYTVKMTKDQLLATRYYYPNGNTGTANGAMGESAALEGKVEVPAIINLAKNSGTLSIGQLLPNEQTWDSFNQHLADGGKIIIGDTAPSWNPVTEAGTKSGGVMTAIVSGSTVEQGTILDFNRPNGLSNKSAKIYYTLDGSTPTVASTFYNYNEYAGNDGVTNSIALDQLGDVTIKTIIIGRGGQDSTISTFTYHVVPKKPGSMTVAGLTTGSTQLKWEAAEGATGYNIYRGLTAGTVTQLVAKDVSGVSYTDKNLTTNTKYYYQVAATFNGYEGTKTNVTGAFTLLPKSVATAQSAGYNSIKISWAPITGAAGYKVYRYNSITKAYDMVGTTSSSSWTNGSLICGKTYYYRVKAFKMDGSTLVLGEISMLASAKPIPAATKSLSAKSNGYNSIKLSWSAVSGATGYYVYRYNSTTKTYVYIGGTTGTALTNTSSALTSGRTYYYKVRAYKLVGTTKVGGAYSVMKSAVPIPSAPKIALTKMSNTSVKVGWSGVSGASYYEIYRKTGSGGTWTLIGKSRYATSRAWTNMNMSPGKTYYYRVRACRMVGTTSVKGVFSVTAGKTM